MRGAGRALAERRGLALERRARAFETHKELRRCYDTCVPRTRLAQAPAGAERRRQAALHKFNLVLILNNIY